MSAAREYYIENRVARIEWRMDRRERCMLCGWEGTKSRDGMRWLEIHEIERRSLASRRWADPCNYLLLCNLCHRDRIPLMSRAEELAIKWAGDPENFDLDRWLRLRDPELRAPLRVTMEDIEEYL